MPGDNTQPATKNNLKRTRSSEELAETVASKRVYSIFANSSKQAASSSSANSASGSTGPFQWIKPSLGPKKSCLHGVNLSPPFRSNIAAFDLDGTLIASSHKKKSGTEWSWWNKVVPGRLKEVYDDGFSIVIISNQNLNAGNLVHWKKKIPLIANALSEVPFRIFAATEKDAFRKPMPGMWLELERMSKEAGVVLDKSKSFYVGDAAGRSGDFAGTDRKWAMNVGLTFYTPEEYFLGLKSMPFKLQGFNVSSLPSDGPLVMPTNTPIVPPKDERTKPEVVLFVGMPAMGKTSFYKRFFKPEGYVHINQDTIGSRAKCVKAVEAAIKDGKSCVIDNTNRDTQTRKYYLDLVKRLDVPARCFNFEVNIDLAWHNNLFRAFCQPFLPGHDPSLKRDIVPYMAFTSFRDSYEEPMEEEGFSEIRRVHWVFEGSEQERDMWKMWLQIDGK